MAIQTGAVALRGKLGNIVGFNLPNAKVAGSMGARIYQSQVSNPKTEPQAIQRMKMTAAVNFYRALTNILNNAWQGQKYGTKSRYYFMKMAMSQSQGIPFIAKGDKHFYPGEFPVAQGSLPTQGVTAIAGDLATTTLSVGDLVADVRISWGEVSQAIINNSFGVNDGDKVTFIGVGVVNGEYSPMYSYFIINTQSDQYVADVVSGSKMRIAFSNGALQLGFEQLDTEVAAAVIVSRYPQSSGGSWLRSSSTMFIAPTYREQLMGTAAYEAALPSYMASASSMSSDWYLNRGVTGSGTDASWAEGGSNLQIVSSESGRVTIGSWEGSYYLLTMSDGTYRVAKHGNYIVNGGSLSGGFVYSEDAPAPTAETLAVIRSVAMHNPTGYQEVDAELSLRP